MSVMGEPHSITNSKNERYPSYVTWERLQEGKNNEVVEVKRGFLIDILKELECLKRKIQPLLK